jgi:ornithine cyclodeaminase/alanine dehydrogenase
MTKWASIVAENSGRGLPNVTSLIILTELATGQPLAILDGNWITAARTAAMTAVAATFLARADSRTIGFIGCGVQARSHLSSLTSALPGLTHARVYGRRRGSSDAFAEEVRQAGLAARVVEDPRAAVEGCEVVVTTVPSQPGLQPFLEPAWVAPGGFVAAVDLGRHWQPARLRQDFDLMITDDHRQSEALGRPASCPMPGPSMPISAISSRAAIPAAVIRRSGRCSCSRDGAGGPRHRRDDLCHGLREGHGAEAAAMMALRWSAQRSRRCN